MKFHFALVLLLIVPATLASFAPSIEDDLHRLEDDCSKETGLDNSHRESIRRSRTVPDDETANKWAKCMMQKHNVITSDGTIVPDAKSINIPADTDTVIRAFPKCSKLSGRDIADTARLMMTCYMKESEGLVMGIRSRPDIN